MGRFSLKTLAALEDLLAEYPEMEEAADIWVRREDVPSLRRFLKYIKEEPFYRKQVVKILRKQYGDKITVYRRGLPKYRVTSVTPWKQYAEKLGLYGSLYTFEVRTANALAALPYMECEILVQTSYLKRI